MAWLEAALPSCTSDVIPGGTHAFVYDKGGMEEVFAAAHKGVQEARVSENGRSCGTRRLTQGRLARVRPRAWDIETSLLLCRISFSFLGGGLCLMSLGRLHPKIRSI